MFSLLHGVFALKCNEVNFQLREGVRFIPKLFYEHKQFEFNDTFPYICKLYRNHK